ncbi:MAG: hypothetical protein J4215_04815 [Candidatus Diapherotrites archaeon]|uniref:Uncharacterized protein n=1 Tax=Candidatus Iainarchaeum sp. TaxID=3101447 RepID=A0A8T4L5R3_9ARCH|nr:hypothetical protein [Candidatus Diapherotrites archaeon]
MAATFHPALLLVIAFIAVIGIYFLWFQQPTIVPATEAEEEVIADSNLVDGNPIDPLPEYASLSDCANKTYSDEQDCRRQVAVKTQSVSACEGLLPADVDWCKARVIVSSGKTDSCASLAPNPQNQCFFDSAKQKGDASLCAQVTWDSFRSECYRDVASMLAKPELCQSIPNPDEKDDCIIRAVINQENPSSAVCGTLSNSEAQDDCFYALALILGQESLCNRISDPYWVSNCITDLNSENDF